MAEEPRFEHSDPATSAMDYASHEKTYEHFLTLTKWSSIVTIAILALMALFLV